MGKINSFIILHNYEVVTENTSLTMGRFKQTKIILSDVIYYYSRKEFHGQKKKHDHVYHHEYKNDFRVIFSVEKMKNFVIPILIIQCNMSSAIH